MRKRYWIFSIVFLLIVTGIYSEIKIDDKAWNIDDILKEEYADSFDISPEGDWVAWVRRSPNQEVDKLVGHIYKTSLIDSTEIQLTRGEKSCRNPQWSPNGKLIAFLSSRGDEDCKTQIWQLNSNGGESYKLTSFEKGVRSSE